MASRSRASAGGYTLVEILIVVAIIGLLTAIVYPAYFNARERSMTSTCLSNLREISDAKDAYALDHANTAPADLGDLVPTYISRTPICPASGTYTINASDEDATCSVPQHAL